MRQIQEDGFRDPGVILLQGGVRKNSHRSRRMLVEMVKGDEETERDIDPQKHVKTRVVSNGLTPGGISCSRGQAPPDSVRTP